MSSIVQSVERTLTILEVLADQNDGMGVTEISEKVNLHKSTVYRLLSTLISKGYVQQNLDTNKYRTTLKLYELGMKRVQNIDIVSASKEHSEQLMLSVNEVVHLVVRDNNEIVYVDKVDANNTIRMASTIGKRSPMYCTSVGKAILAYLSNEDVEGIWEETDIVRNTPNTIVSLEVLKEELKEIRKLGYALDNEENEPNVSCVGAPIFDQSGNIAGAISISGPSVRVQDKGIGKIAQQVTKYAQLISQELGFVKLML